MGGPKCINCGMLFPWKSGQYCRATVHRTVNKVKELRLVLCDLMAIPVQSFPEAAESLSLEPRSLCMPCYSIVVRLEKRKIEIEEKRKAIETLKGEFLSKTSPGGYLGVKRVSEQQQERKANSSITCPLASTSSQSLSTVTTASATGTALARATGSATASNRHPAAPSLSTSPTASKRAKLTVDTRDEEALEEGNDSNKKAILSFYLKAM